jgi:hypothetical protein
MYLKSILLVELKYFIRLAGLFQSSCEVYSIHLVKSFNLEVLHMSSVTARFLKVFLSLNNLDGKIGS